MSDRQRSDDILPIILFCVLILGGLLAVGGALSWHFTRVRAVEAMQRAQVAQMEAEAARQIAEQARSRRPNPDAQIASTPAAPLRVVSWNIESAGSSEQVIAEQLAALGMFDIYALQAVHPNELGGYMALIQAELGDSYQSLMSSTGDNERLLIVFDRDRLLLRESTELFGHGDWRLSDGQHPAPLVTHFRDKQSGWDFKLMTVELAERDESLLTEQVAGLANWIIGQEVPVLAAGDFGFRYDFEAAEGNSVFRKFYFKPDTSETIGEWTWIQPQPMADTHWTDEDQDGRDDHPQMLQDFVFIGAAQDNIEATCRILVRPNDFPDDETTANHRPIVLEVTWPASDKE